MVNQVTESDSDLVIRYGVIKIKGSRSFTFSLQGAFSLLRCLSFPRLPYLTVERPSGGACKAHLVMWDVPTLLIPLGERTDKGGVVLKE